MKTPIMKPWINRDEEPRNVYELLGFALLDADRAALLAASESANEDLLNYQNIADAAKQTRALKLFEILGRFQAVLETPDLLRQHEDKVIDDLRTRCIGAFGNDSSRWSHPQLQQWLLHQRVHPASVPRVLGELLRPGRSPRDISAAPRVFGQPGPAASSYLDPHVVDVSPPTVSAADLDANTVDLSDYIDQSATANAAYKLLPLEGGPSRAAPPIADAARAAATPARAAKPTAALIRMQPAPLPFAEPVVKKSGLIFFLAGAGIAGVVVLLALAGWLLFSEKQQPVPKGVQPKGHQAAELDETNQLSEPSPSTTDGGPGANRTLEQLKKDLGAGELEVRIKAVKDIGMMQPPPKPEEVFAELLDALRSGDEKLVVEANRALLSIGTPNDLGLTCDLLTEALKGKPLAPRQYAVKTLAALSKPVAPAQPVVREKLESAFFVALADNDEDIAKQAAATLWTMGPFRQDRHAGLMKALASGQPEVRTFAFKAVIRDFAEDPQQMVTSAVNAGHADMVRAAVKSWRQLGKQGGKLLRLALREADLGIAQEAVSALKAEKLRLRPDDLLEAQKSRHAEVRAYLVESLSWPDLDAKTAVAILKPALDDPEDTVKTAAVASLEKALDSNNERARRTAFACLESLEKKIPNAEQLFFAALKDKDATISAKARAAIRQDYPGSTKKLIAEMRAMLGKTEEQTRIATLTLVELKADKELLAFIDSSERAKDWLHVCKALLQNKPQPPVLDDVLKPKFAELEKLGGARRRAIKELAQLGKEIAPKLDPLFAEKGNNNFKRVGAALVLTEIGRDALGPVETKKLLERLETLHKQIGGPYLTPEIAAARAKMQGE